MNDTHIHTHIETNQSLHYRAEQQQQQQQNSQWQLMKCSLFKS